MIVLFLSISLHTLLNESLKKAFRIKKKYNAQDASLNFHDVLHIDSITIVCYAIRSMVIVFV